MFGSQPFPSCWILGNSERNRLYLSQALATPILERYSIPGIGSGSYNVAGFTVWDTLADELSAKQVATPHDVTNKTDILNLTGQRVRNNRIAAVNNCWKDQAFPLNMVATPSNAGQV